MSMRTKMHRVNEPRPRRALFAVAAVVATATALTLTAGSASAVHDTGAFELDGNAVNGPAPGDDWDNVCHQVLHSDCGTTSDTSAAGGATAVDWVAEPNLNSTIFTGGGSKDPQDVSNWAWKDGAGGLPDKDNLLHSFAARYNTSEGNVLFFGSDRYDNSGDAQQGFWFFQNSIGLGNTSINGGTGFTGVHRAGDLLVISDFSNGGTTSTVTVYKWDPTCKKAGGTCGDANLRTLATSTNANCASAPADDTFCGIVNPTNGTTAPWTYADKSGNNSYLQGEFYEGGVNLSTLGLADRCFASVASETRSSTSTTATLKDFVLGGFGTCGSSVTTQESTGGTVSIGTGSVSVRDSATVAVTGISTWSGTVQFRLRGPIGGTNETSTDVGAPVSISNSTATVSSPTAAVTSAGDYCWSAHFSSNTTGVPDANDSGGSECFTVTPVTPMLSTQAGSSPVNYGQPISDTAILSGTARQPGTPAINPQTAGAPAGGTLTFTAYGPDNCSTVAFTSSAVTVSGDGTYGPVSFTPTSPGTYHWAASYSGNAPNTNSTDHNTGCTDANENVVVNQVQPTISTAQRWLSNDSATIAAGGGGNLNGSVRFRLYDDNTCSGTALYDSGAVSVSGAAPQTASSSNTTTLTTSRTVSWLVEYTSSNPAQKDVTSSCNTENSSLTINNG